MHIGNCIEDFRHTDFCILWLHKDFCAYTDLLHKKSRILLLHLWFILKYHILRVLQSKERNAPVHLIEYLYKLISFWNGVTKECYEICHSWDHASYLVRVSYQFGWFYCLSAFSLKTKSFKGRKWNIF